MQVSVQNFQNSKKKNHLNKFSVQEEKSEHFFISTWKTFAKNTSTHGVHYLVTDSMNITEKSLWAIAILIALTAMAFCCLLLSNRFKESLLSTVFESLEYPVGEIPFAAVTLCNNNRLDYNKTEAAIEKFFPNRSKSETETFVKFVHTFQNMEWGSFDEFGVVAQDDISEINKLNISQLYIFMMHNCEDFFVSCLWKKIPFKCCDYFSRQRSEYGVCWSFNSNSNAGTKFVNVSLSRNIKNYDLNPSRKLNTKQFIFHLKRSSNFPLRIRRHGSKSALRVVVNTHPETSIDRSEVANSNPGIMAMVNHPSEWPANSFFIAAGSIIALRIKPTAFSTSPEVSDLDPHERQCNFNVSFQKKF